MTGTMNYYGLELLSQIREAYMKRYTLAVERGYGDSGDKYYWLYEELLYRLQLLRQVFLFLNALPVFIKKDEEIEAVRYVVRYTTRLFLKENCGSMEGENGRNPYFNEENGLFCDFTESINHIDKDYDLSNHPLLYVDLTECAVRAVRLYFQIRERQFHAIDRANFNALMQVREQLPAPA